MWGYDYDEQLMFAEQFDEDDYELLIKLSHSIYVDVREQLARNLDIPRVVLLLFNEANRFVREVAFAHPGVTQEDVELLSNDA